MQIYLPIAEISMNFFLVLGMGGLIGFLSGMFGVGGGFLMTPLLILVGVPPPIAVGTGTNQIVGASVSGVLAYWRRGAVDLRMGLVLVVGGVLGTAVGVWVFRMLQGAGQIDLLIYLCYVLFLGTVGALMLYESGRAMIRRYTGRPARRARRGALAHALPLKMRFRASKLYISVIPPVLIGFLVGLLSAFMGVGGGFIMVPAMIYLLGMPTGVVIGTSLFQIIFVTASATILHAANTQTVDVILALILLAGAVIGAQLGAGAGLRLRAEQLRAALAFLVLLVCLRLAYELVARPADLFSLSLPGGLPS